MALEYRVVISVRTATSDWRDATANECEVSQRPPSTPIAVAIAPSLSHPSQVITLSVRDFSRALRDFVAGVIAGTRVGRLR